MRILHLCLSCFYVDGFSYQENELAARHLEDGHEVRIVASTEQLRADGKFRYCTPSRYIGQEGAEVVRLPYGTPFPFAIAKKLRIYVGLYEEIASFAPDVILFHGACSGDLATVARYVRERPAVKLYVDSHEDFVNSARGFLSKWLLHYLYYRPILRRSLPYIERVLPVSVSCQEFMREFYRVPAEKLEFYPVGGEVPDDSEYRGMRDARRDELGLRPKDVLVVQSGKIDRAKKLVEALHAFSMQDDPQVHFAIAGHISADVEEEVNALLAANPRIHFLGWQSPDQLRALLCAADVYCQPGTQSATMQMAVCCRCAILLDDVPSHHPYLDGNGWLVRDAEELGDVFRQLPSRRGELAQMAGRSHQLALRMLDYRLLAARIYR